MTDEAARTTESFEATAKARLRQLRAVAQATTDDLDLPPEFAPAVLLATRGGSPADAIAAVQEAIQTMPAAENIEAEASWDRLRETLETLLREQLQKHLAEIRQTLQFGGFAPTPAPAFGWRNAPAGDDEDIWATPVSQSPQQAADAEALLYEVQALLDELSQDPSVSRTDLLQALLFVRAGLKELRRHG